jgi:secreted PhoX family phosphatase
VIEIERADGKWRVVPGSKFARRITASTPMEITGPAAGHDLMKTGADPSGTKVLGMLNNCAGGITPWGTWLTCEENFNFYFSGNVAAQASPLAEAYARYGVPEDYYPWGRLDARFDIAREPNESHRFGWVVEIDPFDPTSVPKKRTALGRFKHEGAGNVVNLDGRFVVYQGDDQRFDYVYKFVSAGKVDVTDKAANRDLLDSGTLYVARFDADGRGEWLPLVAGDPKLSAFADQGSILIHARFAADALGATKMDRPEDIDVNEKTGRVYLMLTNNSKRRTEDLNAANPRAENRFGHIIEMLPDGGDHAATGFAWNILVKCGDPAIAEVGATFNAATSTDGWFGMPDNCAIDADGRLWVATDGNNAKVTGRTDGLFALETDGALRGTSRLFFRCPSGAELCGPCFTPDLETLFVAVQHPGESEDEKVPATAENPTTRWPDFKDGMPPRPSIIAITRKGGGKIGV